MTESPEPTELDFLDDDDIRLAPLRSAGERYVAAATELHEATRARDAEILRASQEGFSRRVVAEAAGVTPGRVQQLVGQQQLPKID